MSYMFVDSFRPGPGLVFVILYSCLVCRSICSCIPDSQLYRIHDKI